MWMSLKNILKLTLHFWNYIGQNWNEVKHNLKFKFNVQKHFEIDSMHLFYFEIEITI